MSRTPDPSTWGTSPTLLAGLRVDDEEAWIRLVERYTPKLAAWCRSRGLDATTTEDVIQETWISVARGVSTFASPPGVGAFRAWVHRILLRRIADWRRGQRRALPIQEEESALHIYDRASSDSSIDSVSPGGLKQKLDLLRGSIDERTWEIFSRAYLEGKDTALVAREFNVTTVNVRQIKSRILRKLKQVKLEG